MKRIFGILLALSLSATAAEKQHKLAVGVFLPTTMVDGQQRFDFAEKLASALAQSLGQPVVGRSFGRFEDFSRAVSDGTLDAAIVDAWAAAELSPRDPNPRFEVVGQAQFAGETAQRWALVSRLHGPVINLRGKRIAVTRGATEGRASLDGKFLTNVIFGGDLDAQHTFKIVSVPSVESGLKMLEVKSAEAALVPAQNIPKDANVIYKSPRQLGAIIVAFHAGATWQDAFRKVPGVAPMDRVTELKVDDVIALRKLIAAGPARRQPFIAESPVQRLDPSLVVNMKEVGLAFPSFVETMEVSREQPDD